MAFINPMSKTAINASCDLFSLPVTQRTVENGAFYVSIFVWDSFC